MKTYKTIFFTLIELIIVVAIIAVLVAMLLPALSGAKGFAKRISCMNNLKQLHYGFMNYASTYDDYALPWSYSYYWITGSLPAPFANNPTWSALLVYSNSIQVACKSDGKYPNVFCCPSLGKSDGVYYGINVRCASRDGVAGRIGTDSNWGVGAPYRMSHFTHPSNAFLFMDYMQYVAFEYGWNPNDSGYNAGLFASICPRHGGYGVNSVFLDGHASFVMIKNFPLSKTDAFYTGY